MSTVDLAILLERSPGRWSDEAELQAHLDTVLSPLGFEREVASGADRFDFYRAFDGLVVEVKISGSPAVVLRQLIRYAERTDVREIVLATTKATHGRTIPKTMCGKPVAVARLWLWGLR